MKKLLCIIAAAGAGILCLKAQDRFPVQQLTSSPAQQGFPTWSPDGKYLIYQHSDMQDTLGNNGLWRILADGSGATLVCRELAEHPRWSPDGSLVVFDADTGQNLKMLALEGGPPEVFLPDSIHIVNGGLPCWSPDGSKIAFVEGSGMSLCTCDRKSGDIRSIFRREGLVPLPGGWTPDGQYILVALMDRQTRKSTMWKLSSDGREAQQITGHHEDFYRYLALSPDGTLLVYGVIEDRHVALYVMPADGGPSIRLTASGSGHNDGPCWSPDGTLLAFTSTRSGSFDIWVMEIDPVQLKEELGLSR